MDAWWMDFTVGKSHTWADLLGFRWEAPPMTFHLQGSLPFWASVLGPRSTSQGVSKDKWDNVCEAPGEEASPEISTGSGIFSWRARVVQDVPVCNSWSPEKERERVAGGQGLGAFNNTVFSRNPSHPECKNTRQRKQTPSVDNTGRWQVCLLATVTAWC